MRVVRWTDNEVEIVAHVDYFDAEDEETVLHREEAVFPASYSEQVIAEELRRRGRSARARRGRERPKAEMLGKTLPIDEKEEDHGGIDTGDE